MKQRPHPYQEIDFGFVFVRAVRAGEAKLRGRARGNSPVAGPRPDQMIIRRQTVDPEQSGDVVIFSLVSRAVSRGGVPGAGRLQIEMLIDMQTEMQI